MPAFLVYIPDTIPAKTLVEGCDSFVVRASDEIDAKAVAASVFAGDTNELLATAVVEPIESALDFEQWQMTVAILDSTPVVNLSVLGAPGAEIDDMAADMVVALNGESIIANASYVSPTLTIAGVGDALGDRTVRVEMRPRVDQAGNPQPIPGYIGTITDQGIVAAALTVDFVVGISPATFNGAFIRKFSNVPV